MKNILMAVLTLAGLGFGFGLLLAWASKKFHVDVDERVVRVIELLPNANCGACGFTGCAAFGEALVNRRASPGLCVALGAENRRRIVEILGLAEEAADAFKTVAFIACGGGKNSKDRFKFEGLADCRAAAQTLGGFKECPAGCFGLGTCVSVCPFDAIKMGPEGIPVIDPARCRSCGKCVAVCPRRLIKMVPRGRKVYVRCSSPEKGAAAIKNCKAACIACGKCVKVCPVNAITIENNLARIDYAKCIDCGKCARECPTKVIRVG